MMQTSSPQVIGITGGIGSGKSIVSKCFHIMGIPVYDCDKEAKRLNHTHPTIRQSLIKLVGTHVYMTDGTLNKVALADYLFATPTHAQQVNDIIHPVVKEDFLQWKSRQHSPWVAIESAILYESRFDSLADKVIAVCAPAEVRLTRACLRDNASPDAIRARMSHQTTDEEKSKQADYTLNNDDKQAILPQILDILANLPCTYRR